MGSSLKRVLVGLAVVMLAFAPAACENPFDPLDKTEEIRGLSYVDYTLTWDRWDSDPEYDGVVVTIEYYNEFGDSLSFHNKGHQVVIEFWTQRIEGGEANDQGQVTGGRPTYESLFFSYPVYHENSDDDIRIPIEAYEGALAGSGYSREEDAIAFVTVRVYPPLDVPLNELIAFYGDQTVYQPEPTAATEDALTEGI